MSYDTAKLKFGGRAISIAEKELSASFVDDDDNQLIDTLYREYQDDGMPRKLNEWLRTRLSDLFACVDDRPKWIERLSLPRWPFKNGLPMVFIRQFEVPRTDVSESRVVPLAMLYVFGTRVNVETGWETEYCVVEQLSNLP
jgi:hypothetical protein